MDFSLKFAPEKIVSQEEFSDIFGDIDGLEVGVTQSPPVENFLRFTELWVSRVDGYILKAKSSELKKYFTRRRGFTYHEFKLLFKEIPEEKFKHYPVFEFLRIPEMV